MRFLSAGRSLAVHSITTHLSVFRKLLSFAAVGMIATGVVACKDSSTTLNPEDIQISVGSVSLEPGESVDISVTVTGVDGVATIAASISGLPSGVTATDPELTLANDSASGTATFTAATDTAAVTATATLTVDADGEEITKTFTVTVTSGEEEEEPLNPSVSLTAVPQETVLRYNGSIQVDVYVETTDTTDLPVVSLADTIEGIEDADVTLASGATSAVLTISAGDTAVPEAMVLTLAAEVNGITDSTTIEIEVRGERGTLNLEYSFDGTEAVQAVIANQHTFNDLIIHDDGSVALGGVYDSYAIAARLDPNGVLDTNFGTDGNMEDDQEAAITSIQLWTMTTRGTGYALVGDVAKTGPNKDYFALGLDSTGTIDTSFGSNGTSEVDAGSNGSDNFGDAVELASGDIVGCGQTSTGSGNWAMFRITADGDLSSDFDGDGLRVIQLDGNNESCSAVAIYDENRFVAAGRAGNTEGIIGRFWNDGTDDTSFGDGPFKVTNIVGSTGYRAVAVHDGEIFTAGNDANGIPMVTKLTSDGSYDLSFGTEATAWATFPGESPWITDIAIGADGTIFVSGATCPDNCNPLIFAFTPNGELDTTFGTNGAFVYDWTGSVFSDGVLNAIGIGPDGEIVAAGYAEHSASETNWGFVVWLWQ